MTNFDVLVQAFSCLTTLLIAGMSVRTYMLFKQIRHLLFGGGFFLVSIGLMFNLVLNAFVDFESKAIPLRGYIPFTTTQTLVFLLGILFTLAGYITLFILIDNLKSRKTILLLYILIGLATVVAHEFYIMYHVVLFVIISLILNYYVFNYRRQRTTSSLLILLGFTGLLISNAAEVFITFGSVFYTLGLGLQLLSFASILAMLVHIHT